MKTAIYLISGAFIVGACLFGCSNDTVPTEPPVHLTGDLDYEIEFGVYGTVDVAAHDLPQTLRCRCEDCEYWVGPVVSPDSSTGYFEIEFTNEEADLHNGHIMRLVWYWPGGFGFKFFTYESPVTGPIEMP